jgi:tetratricopeptide (TPR) repeat protein
MKREIPTITISCGKNDMFMNPPCNSIGNTASSVNYTTWTANSSKYGSAITNLDKSLTTIPESTPYVRPDFVLYTPPSQSFIQPDTTYVVPIQSEVTKKTDPVIVNKKNIDKSVAFRKSKDYENALKSCNEALKADPKYLDGWNEKAAIFIDKAEYKTAIEYCDIAIIIDSKYFYAYNNKAVALRKLEDYENALKSCDEALKINQGYSDARNEKNNILNGFYLQISTLITKKQYEEAIKSCDIIIKSDAKNLHAYHNKVMALRMLEDYENALKNCDKSILYMGNINNYGIEKVEELNKLYLERKKQHIESAVKRDYFYSQGVINGVNGFDWYKANPTRDFYSFFRDTLKVSDKSPENVKLIKGRLYTNLPPYLEEARKSNYFLDEYNKYYKDMVASKEKLSQFIYIYNTKAIASKKLGDYESALKSCDIAIKINPKDLEASNFKKFILKEKRLWIFKCVNSKIGT